MLVTAVALGEVFKRFKLPAIVGQLLAGVILGPTLLNIVEPSESFSLIIDLAVFFLMFLAGLELRSEDIKSAGRDSLILSILAFVVPFVGGYIISDFLGFSLVTSLFIGLTLAITAIPVSAVILMEFNMLKSKMGSIVMTAGVIDDILSLIALAVILQLAAEPNGSFEEIEITKLAISGAKIALFLGGMFLLDLIIKKAKHVFYPKASRWVGNLQTKEISFAILLIIAFSISILAESVGLHFVIGAFFAGLIIGKDVIGTKNFNKVSTVFSAISFGLLSPIFFAFIGIEFVAQSLVDVLPLFVMLLAVAVGGKIAGGFIGGRIARFSNFESFTMGNLVNARGMVELIIATIGLEAGIIDETVFTVIVAIGFITTVMAPVFARICLKQTTKK